MHQSQSSSSLILFSISLLSRTAVALPQWSASEVESYAVTTAAPVAATSAVPDYNLSVTWPAGCESWLNPCPAGVMTSGVAPMTAAVTWPAGCETWANPCPATAIVSAGVPYSNPMTSYTTMTNSAGIITGMPSVATSASGIASVMSEQSVAISSASVLTYISSAVSSGSSSAMPTASPSETQSASATTDNSFSQATFSGAAVANKAAGAGVAMVAMGFALAL